VRRRLLWWALLAAIAVGVAGAILAFPNKSGVERTPDLASGPVRESPEIPPASVPQTAAAQAAALRTARDFIRTAVLRRHVERSWPLTGPKLRQGLTRREWATGNIPVIPYPASALREARWRVGESTRDRLDLDVLLLPKATSTLRSMTFQLELKAVGPPQGRHWLVAGWNPSGGIAVPGALPGSGRIDLSPRGGTSPLGARWLLLPVGVLLLVLLVPAWLLLRGWRHGRHAARAFRDNREAA
jgi:hypothetical protein